LLQAGGREDKVLDSLAPGWREGGEGARQPCSRLEGGRRRRSTALLQAGVSEEKALDSLAPGWRERGEGARQACSRLE
jgi:hypothetical protein